MQSAIEIRHLSKEEKLRIMEAIWEDLTREDEEVESPTWHLDVLQKTNQQFRLGKEKILDWSDAKKKLRERFE